MKASRQRPCRSQASDGFALPNVLALSVIITMFATALLSAMMPIYQRTGLLKNGNTARAVAEAALDYTIGQLNNSLVTGQINTQFDPGTTAGSSKQVSIDPVGTLGFNFGNNTVPQVTVLVENLANVANTAFPPYPNDPASANFHTQFSHMSILYDPSPTSLAYANNSYLLKPGTTNVTGANYPNPYRRLTVTVIFGSVVKNVRVILQPLVTASTTSTTAQTGFPFGIFGTNYVELVGQAATNSYNSPDPRLYADLGTLGAVNEIGTGSVTRGTVEGGYHMEFPPNLTVDQQAISASTTNWNASVVSQAPWAQIMGNVFSNGDTTGYWPRGGTTATVNVNSWNNIFGMPDGINPGAPTGYPGPYTDSAQQPGYGSNPQYVPISYGSNNTPTWSGGIVDGYEKYAAPPLPAVPQAGTGTLNLGSINLNGNGSRGSIGTLKITSSVSAPTTSGSTMSIPPGDYIVNTLTLSNGAQISIDPSTTTPTRFFMQGANGGTTAVSVDNTSQINMSGITANTGMNTSGNNGVYNYVGSTAVPTAASNQLAITPTNQITETSGAANQLQMYYSGTQNFYLLGNERMVIYAPNATVNIGAQPLTNAANYYGAVVAAVPRVMSDFYSGAGAFFHYDFHLRPSGLAAFTDPNQVGNLPPMVTGSIPVITGYRAVTWQEAVVPNTNLAQVRWF